MRITKADLERENGLLRAKLKQAEDARDARYTSRDICNSIRDYMNPKEGYGCSTRDNVPSWLSLALDAVRAGKPTSSFHLENVVGDVTSCAERLLLASQGKLLYHEAEKMYQERQDAIQQWRPQ